MQKPIQTIAIFFSMIITAFMPLSDVYAGPKIVNPFGFYDLAIPTNCLRDTSQNLNTPNWTQPTPIFSGNSISMYARTIQNRVFVNFFSSNPAIINPPAKVALNPGSYQRTMFKVRVREVTVPTPITISASEEDNLVKQDLNREQLLLLPKFDISRIELLPKKTIYQPGDRVSLVVTLNQSMPVESERGISMTINAPEFQSGTTATSSGLSKNTVLIRGKGKNNYKKSFTFRWPTNSELNNFRSEKLKMTLSASIFTMDVGCIIVKSREKKTLDIYLKNPNYSAPRKGKIVKRI